MLCWIRCLHWARGDIYIVISEYSTGLVSSNYSTPAIEHGFGFGLPEWVPVPASISYLMRAPVLLGNYNTTNYEWVAKTTEFLYAIYIKLEVGHLKYTAKNVGSWLGSMFIQAIVLTCALGCRVHLGVESPGGVALWTEAQCWWSLWGNKMKCHRG